MELIGNRDEIDTSVHVKGLALAVIFTSPTYFAIGALLLSGGPFNTDPTSTPLRHYNTLTVL